MIKDLGIEAIQKGYEEIAEEIYRLQNEHNVDEGLLIKLIGKLSSLDNYKLDSLFDTVSHIGVSELCELYQQLRGLYEKELSILREKMVTSAKTPHDAPMLHPQFYLQPTASKPESATLWNNKEFVRVAVKKNGLALQHASRELQSDKELVLAAVTQNGLALQYASEELKRDKEIVLAAVTKNGEVLQYVNKEFKSDREVVIAAVTQYGCALMCASEDLQRDREVVLTAVNQNGLALKLTCKELKSDKEIVLAAVSQDNRALQHANEELKRDRGFVLNAVSQNGLALQYVDEKLRKDKVVVHAAVTQNGLALEYSSDLWSREIVLIAVTQNGLALQHASNKWIKDICLIAVTQNGLALEHVSEELKRDREVVSIAVAQNGLALRYANKKLSSDRDFVLAAVTQNGLALQYAEEKFKREREIVLAAVTQNGLALQYAVEEFKSDQEIVLAALKQNHLALQHVSKELRNNSDFMLAAVRQNGVELQLYALYLPRVGEKGAVERPDLELISGCLKEIHISERDVHFFIPLIRLIATHLIKEPIETHLAVFSILSKRSDQEALRDAYLEVLERSYADKDKLEQLRAIPNEAGDRLSFLKRQSNLKTQLEAITTDNLSELPFDPKLPWAPRVMVRSSQRIRYLRPEIAREIIDVTTNNLKNGYPGSGHPVTCAAGLHFKQKPSNPLMEYAIHSLLFRLSGELTPQTELVRFEVDGKKLYPVQVSTTVPGITLKKRLETPLKLEEPEQWARWTWMLLSSVLTRPGDGRLSNYILDSQDNVYCVDNDISFVEPVTQSFVSQVQFCSALFCLFQDRPLDRNVLAEFCSIDAEKLLLSWIDDVIDKEEEYSKLFTEEERQLLYAEDPNNRFRVNALFKKGTLATLFQQFVYLQNQLNILLKDNKIPTPTELLKYIITLTESPHLMNSAGEKVSKRYLEASHPSVQDRLQWILSRSQETSMTSIQTDQVCLGRTPTFEEVGKKGEFSSKKAKEELLDPLQRRLAKTGKSVFQANFKKMWEADVPDLERQRLTLLALTSRLQGKLPTSLAIQHCAVLNTKSLDPFLHQDLEFLDLSYCPNIKNSDVEIIQKKCPKLKELYLRGCSGLTALETWKMIGSEVLSFSNLRVLHAESCPNLKRVNLRCPGLQVVNLDNCASLNYVRLVSCFQINKTHGNCPKLEGTVTEALDLKDLETSGTGLFNDRNFMLIAVQQNCKLLKYASEECKNDRDIVLAAVEQNWEVLKYVKKELHSDDRDIMLAVVRQNGIELEFVSKRLRNDRDVVLAAVQQNEQALKYASKELRDDREIVLAALQKSGIELEFASERLRNDRGVILVAVQQDRLALQYASKELRDDREIVLAALHQWGIGLEFASERLRNDRDFVLAAVQQNGLALQYASERLRNDRDFVLAAVRQNGLALLHASKELRGDREIVLVAIEQNKEAITHASVALLRNDGDMALLAVQQSWHMLSFINEELTNYRDIVLTAVRQDVRAFMLVSNKLKQDKKFVLTVVTQNGLALQYAGREFKDDHDIVQAAVEQNRCAVQYASDRLKEMYQDEMDSPRQPM